MTHQERQDLAEALLVQGEMREHDKYVQEGNVFTLPNDDRREDDEFLWGDPTFGP